METGEGEVRAEAPGALEWHHLEPASPARAAPFSFALAACVAGDPRIRLQPDPRRIFPVSPSVYNRRLITCSRARSRVAPARANMRPPVAHVAGGRRDPRAGRARGLRPHPQRVVVRDRVRRVRPGGTRHRSGFARRARRCCRVSRCVVAPRRRTRRRAARGPRATVSSRPPRANGDAYARRDGSRARRDAASSAPPRAFSPRHPTSRSWRAEHAHISPRSRLIAPSPPFPPVTQATPRTSPPRARTAAPSPPR